MPSTSSFDMEVKRDHLTVRVAKMRKNGSSQEQVGSFMRQEILKDVDIPEGSKSEFYDSVMTEVQELVGVPKQAHESQTGESVNTPSETLSSQLQEPVMVTQSMQMPGNKIELISSYSDIEVAFCSVLWPSAKLGEHSPMRHNETN